MSPANGPTNITGPGHPATSGSALRKRSDWWRRGESEYSAVLKTRNLLIFRDAQNAENGKMVLNWNLSGTRKFSFPGELRTTYVADQNRSKTRLLPPECAISSKTKTDAGADVVSRWAIHRLHFGSRRQAGRLGPATKWRRRRAGHAWSGKQLAHSINNM
jgi:hypothetical protein